MHITIFGATGGTGGSLVRQAVAAGHQVTAVVRDPARLAVTGGPEPRADGSAAAAQATAAMAALLVVTADVLDPAAIAPAVAGADAVISAIGPRGTGPTTVSQDSTAAIVAAMHATGAGRLVTISGSIVTDAGDDLLLRLVKPLVRRTQLRHVCADMRRAEDEVRHSGLEWTIMRPPRLTGKPAAGHYRTAIDRNLPRDYTISREDLAACILGLIADPETVRKHVAVAN
jgi:putative NADH-flavin reductase